MAKQKYAAMLEPAAEGIGISFPDVPGCVSFGASLDEALRNGEQALSLHFEGMIEDGDQLPEPRYLGDLIAERFSEPDASNVTWYLMEVELPDEAERVNVYLPRSLLQRVDTYASASGLNRSAFFATAARSYLGETDGRPTGLDPAALAGLKRVLGLRVAD